MIKTPWPLILGRLKLKVPLESKTLPKCNHLYFGPLVILSKNFMKLDDFFSYSGNRQRKTASHKPPQQW